VGETYEDCVADCPDCDDINDCTDDSFDYHEQKCVNKAILGVVCCGNGLCELRETYESCTRDCPDCDDNNECTKDLYDYHKQKCINEVIIPCCGNEICDEDAETLSNCPADCPDCDDNNKLTGDSFNYTTQKCEYISYSFIDDFEDGDLSGWDICMDCTGDKGSVITENGNKVLRSYGQNDIHSGSDSWTDYTFTGKFKIIKGSVGMWVREFSGRYQLWADEREIVFTVEEYEIDSTKITSKRLSMPLNEWHDFKIIVKGTNLKFYFNDNLVIDANDNDNKFPRGRVGIGSGDNSDVYFDDLKVRES
jgi:hypothetical protein